MKKWKLCGILALCIALLVPVISQATPVLANETPPVEEAAMVIPEGSVRIGDFNRLRAYIRQTRKKATIVITKDIAFWGTITIPDGVEIELLAEDDRHLPLADQFMGKRHFRVGKNSSLLIGENLIIDGAVESAPDVAYAGGVEVLDQGTLLLTGTISRCQAENGGGVLVNQGGTFELLSGTISECMAIQSGGGVYLSASADSSVTAGRIESCTAYAGGGLFLAGNSRDCVFELAGTAQIANCQAVWREGVEGEEAQYPQGGGVFVKQGTFQMTGQSEIIGCESEVHGGGIASGKNGLIMLSEQAAIRQCRAHGQNGLERGSGNGGGVHALGAVYLSGGMITECTSLTNGGGIYISSADGLLMKDGGIRSCSSGNGGGIYAGNEKTQLNLLGGTIADCFGTNYGGGISVNGAKAVLGSSSESFTIESCTAGSDESSYWGGIGGGLYIYNGGDVSFVRGTIKDCVAVVGNGNGKGIYGSGGGIFVAAGSHVSLGGTGRVDVLNCQAEYHGGGIFAEDYQDLTTRDNVYFADNRAIVYSEPGDNIVRNPDSYPCTLAASVSAAPEGEQNTRNYPLNNYDINYLSMSVIYYGNGGANRDGDEYRQVLEANPFQTEKPSEFSDTYMVLPNTDTTEAAVAFVNTGAAFGLWSEQSTFSESGTLYEGGETWTGNIDDLLNQETRKREFYALWTKEVRLMNQVYGGPGDRDQVFEITVAFDDDSNTFRLKHGEMSEAMRIYSDSSLSIIDAAADSENYTVRYHDGINSLETYENQLLSSNPEAFVIVTVEHQRRGIIGSLSAAGIEPFIFLLVLGGIVGVLIVVIYFQVRKRKRAKKG